MKYRILNNNSLEFFDATANNTGLIAANGTNIKISANNGVIELGDTASDVQVGTLGTAINWTFLGGGTIGTGGVNTLNLGQSGDIVNLSQAGVTYYFPSYLARTSDFATTASFSSPPPIGNTSPNTGQFTTLNVRSNLVVGNASSIFPTTGNLTIGGASYFDGEVFANNGIIIKLDSTDFAKLEPKLVWRRYSTNGVMPLDSNAMTANLRSNSASSSATTFVSQGTTPNIQGFTFSADNYIAEFSGYIYANTGGVYTFGVNSDDNSDLFVDGKLVADWYQVGGHGPNASGTPGGNQRTIYLNQGYHRIYTRFVEASGGDTHELCWKNPSDSGFSVIPAGQFYHHPTDLIMNANDNILLTQTTLITNTTNSISNTTGALVVSGGVGITGNIYVSGTNTGITSPNVTLTQVATASFPLSFGQSVGNKIALYESTLPSVGTGYGFGIQAAQLQIFHQTSTNFTSIGHGSSSGFTEQFRVASVASAVNYLQATGNTTGLSPVLSAQGSDTNVDVTLVAKGTGSTYIKTGGNTAFKIDGVYGAGSGATTAVNYWNPSGSAAGNGLRMDIGGSDADVSMFYITKGAGSVFFNSGGSSGTTQFKISPTASAVNWVQVTGSTAGLTPIISAQGSDGTIALSIQPKGASGYVNIGNQTNNYFQLYPNSGTGGPTFWTWGSDTDVPLNIATKGAGNINFKTNSGANNQFVVASTASAVNYIQVAGAATGFQPIVSVQGTDPNVGPVFSAKGSGSIDFYTQNVAARQFSITNTNSAVNSLYITGNTTGNGPVLSAQGSDTNVDVNITPKGTGSVRITPLSGGASGLVLSQDITSLTNSSRLFLDSSGGTVAILNAGGNTFGFATAATIGSATGTTQMRIAHVASADRYAQVSGGQAGVNAPGIGTAGGSECFDIFSSTNKLRFYTGGAKMVGTVVTMAHVASPVNYIEFAGNTTGGGVIISGQGSDTNVGININPKGAGSANVTSTANSTSNTTGALVVAGGMGITGNLYMSAANNFSLSTEASYRLGWTDNYFTRSALYGGMNFSGSYLTINPTLYTNGLLTLRNLICSDIGNNTVLFAGSSPVRLQNTAISTSNTTGSLIVGGGAGISGNLWAQTINTTGVAGTFAGLNDSNGAGAINGSLYYSTSSDARFVRTASQQIYLNHSQSGWGSIGNQSANTWYLGWSQSSTAGALLWGSSKDFANGFVVIPPSSNLAIQNTSTSAITVAGGISIGSGVTGQTLQPYTGGNFAALYNNNITPSSSNYSLAHNGTSTFINGTGGVYCNINDAVQLTVGASNVTVDKSLIVNKDLTVSGNLIITGNVSSQNVQQLAVADPLIVLGIGNYVSDTKDIGFAAHYNDGTNAHAGLIRDSSTKEFYMFQGYTPEVDALNNVVITDPSFSKANLNANYVKSNLIATTAVVNGIDLSTYTQATYAQANVTIGVDASQNVRLDYSNTAITIIQGIDAGQNTRMTVIESTDVGQNSRMTIIEGTDTSQNSRMTVIESTDVSQNVRIDYSNTAITIIQGVDTSQNARMVIIEGTNASQNVRIDYSNTALTIAQGVDNSQNVRIDYSNTALTIAQGIDDSQNVRINYSNTAITIIQGVDTTQNTNIAATDGKMQLAYNTANNAVANIGPVITTNTVATVIIANTTASTSNSTGALRVSGGVGVSGNIFVGGTSAGPTGVYTDILRYSANGQPWSFGGGGSIAITNDTTNSTTLFPLLSTANSGTLSTANTSNTKLYYVPSTGTLNATVFNSLSDAEYKENIITITDALNTVNQIDGVSFSWKDNGLKSYGVVAQELEKILPELVNTVDNVKSVNYSGIIAFLINSVKELDTRVKQLESK